MNEIAHIPTVDLTSCDKERIHLLGSVQPFGALLAVTPDWIVTRASQNTEDHWHARAEDMIGTALSDYAQPSFMTTIGKRTRMLIDDDSVERIFGIQLIPGEGLYDVALHASGGGFVIEVERHNEGEKSDYSGSVRRFVERLKLADSREHLLDLAARQMKLLTGFDRVMVYRLSDGGEGGGEVVGEACEDHLESFKGLRYPASDIPAQARKMYLRSLLRIISDVNADPVAIIPDLGADRQPLDLTLSSLRAVSPIHLEYLRNMGVGASMSISIIRDGRLWGLFACHHYSPRILSYEVRSAAELLGQMFSFILSDFEAKLLRTDDAEFRRLHDRLMSQLADGSNLSTEFETIANTAGSVIDCDGFALYAEGIYQARGDAPDEAGFLALSRFLNTAGASRVFATDNLLSVVPGAKESAPEIAGLLAIPVSRNPRDYAVCFRKEAAQSVTWAGNPEKPVEIGPNGARLTPRKSFEAWIEEVSDTSVPWTPAEVHAAEALRLSLLEVVLKISGNAAKEAKHAAQRQDLLISELNHRVRNILNLIRGLISQSATPDEDVVTFSEKIGGRVHALARAHDLITKEQWAPASLYGMLKAEFEAYVAVDNSRLQLTGPDVLLAPTAFTAIALVMHEMVTNSAKYGALTDQRGQVHFSNSFAANGDLIIEWADIGGPAVQAPTRRGFGTTIIERSIPFELKGEAAIKFNVNGVTARFRIPAEYITNTGELEMEPEKPKETERAAASALSGHALIVEDNIIIAMDSEIMLKKLGAETIHLASNVAEALRLLEKHPIEFALLDVNLGSETSTPVANALQKAECPFIFATGYGDSGGVTDAFPNAKIAQKPVNHLVFRDLVAPQANEKLSSADQPQR